MRHLLPPALAFLFARGVMFLAALRAFRGGPESALAWGGWLRWDSRHYVDIASDGYRLLSCADVAGYAPQDACGNTGWFPGYPALLRALLLLRVPATPAAVLISAVFAFLALHALWTRLLEARMTRANLLALAVASVAPGAVYQHAAFPISMLLFFQIRAMDALARERFLAAGLWGAAAAFTYPSGALLIVAMLGCALARRRAGALGSAGATAAGFALVLALLQVAVGDWRAFFAVQRKYGFGLAWPQATLAERLAPLFGDGTLFPALQTLLVALLMLGLLVALAVRRRRVTRADAIVALQSLVYWLAPLTIGGGLSLHRADALLMPAAILTRHLPAPLQWGVLGAVTFTAFRVAARFFRGVLV